MQQHRALKIAEAKTLFEAGDLAGAEAIFQDLVSGDPGHFAGFLGLARIAAARGAWDAAAAFWGRLIAGFPDRVQRPWRLGHARALVNSGQPAQARAELLICLESDPGDAPAVFLVTKMLQAGAREESIPELTEGILREAPVFTIMLARTRMFLWLHDMKAARAAFAAGIALAESASQLDVLFEHVAQLFDGWQRADAWRHIESLVDALPAAPPLSEEAGERAALRLRVRVSLRDYDGFLDGLARAADLPLPEPFAGKAAQLSRVLKRSPFPDFAAPKIFGIGLSKTGTTSLTAALEMLGLTTAHFRNDFSEAIIADDDFFLFDALTDTPVAAQFERLYFLFPNARFIYTTRGLDDWTDSFRRYFEQTQGTADFAELRRRIAQGRVSYCGRDFAALTSSLYVNYPDATTAYRAFAARVENFFADKSAGGKLLVHDVFAGHGWPELCAFLGYDVPDVPYPWENKSLPASPG